MQTLLERELRTAQTSGDDPLPLYPEGRDCKRPTTRRVLDIFEPIQRHTLTHDGAEQTFVTDLSPVHRRVLKLLGAPRKDYGR